MLFGNDVMQTVWTVHIVCCYFFLCIISKHLGKNKKKKCVLFWKYYSIISLSLIKKNFDCDY